MYTGIIVISIFIILTAFGFLKTFFKKWRISEVAAILVGLAIIGGLLIPPFEIGEVLIISIGGFVIPFIVSLYLLVRSASAKEVLRTVFATLIIGSIGANLIYFFPFQGEIISFDYGILLGLVAAGIAFIIGRSRRGAFVAAALGTMLISIFEFNIYWTQGYPYVIVLGSHSMFTSTIIASFIAAIVAEIAGETSELAHTGRTDIAL